MNNFSIHDDVDELNRIIPGADALTEGKLAKKIGASLIAGSIGAHPGKTAKRPEIPAETDKTTVADSKEPGTEVVGTVTVPSDKVELKTTLTTGPDGISDPVTFNMGAIADTSGMWGSEAGRKFIDSLKRFYAGYGIIATFENIKVNLHQVSKETIRELCVDPGSGESLDTEYACTVNYPDQYGDIVADIKFRYDNIRKAEFPAIDKLSVFTKSKTHGIIPGYDREQLSFNIYVDKSLPHLQERTYWYMNSSTALCCMRLYSAWFHYTPGIATIGLTAVK